MDEQHTPPPTGDDTPGTPPQLTEEDARALEAFFEADQDLERVPDALRARAQQAAALFGLLATGPVDGRDSRVSRVLAGADATSHATLSRDDAEALDAWMLAGLDAERVPASLRERARAHDALASLIASPAPESVSQFTRAHLIERTLNRVAEAGHSQEPAITIPQRNRLADVLSVAAVLLIAASVLWPVMSTVRDSSRQAACAGNMRSVANAMGLYTADNDEMLPMVTAGFGKSPWWNVGSDPAHSNSANLYALSKQPYARLADLACPGNPRAITVPRSPDARDWGALEEISYSYRVMARPERLNWGQPSELVIVTDRSPVVLRAVRGQLIFPLESSPNHQGQGQHGLTADGAAQWLTTPALPSGDNIWLPKPIEMFIDMAARRQGIDPIRGTEAPAGRQDSFVGP